MDRPSIPALRDALTELVNDFERVLAAGVVGGERLSATLAYGYLKRATGTLRGVLALSVAGHGSELGALTRVITESGIFVTWMLQSAGKDRPFDEREARAQDIWDAQLFEDERRRRIWEQIDYGPKGSAAIALQGILQIRKKRGLKANEKFELKVSNLAEQAGGGLGEHYDLAYRINCLDAHPTLHAMMRALQEAEEQQEFTHSRTLFISCISGLNLAEAGYQLIGRGDEYVALRDRVTKRMGLPAGAVAPKA